MHMPDFLSELIKAAPRLKTKVQLSGVAIAAVVAYLIHAYAPNNVPAIACGGAVGMGVLLFGVVLQVLDQFPSSQRAWLVLGAFVVALLTMLGFAFLAFYFAT